MKTKSASHWRTRAVRVLAPCCAAGLVITGCGGADSPTGQTQAPSVVGAVQTPGPASEAPSAAASAQIGSKGDVVVASVLPRPRAAPSSQAARTRQPETPARWLDAELPQGTATRPVVVVVPGALPQEASSLGLERAAASRLAR